MTSGEAEDMSEACSCHVVTSSGTGKYRWVVQLRAVACATPPPPIASLSAVLLALPWRVSILILRCSAAASASSASLLPCCPFTHVAYATSQPYNLGQ